MGNNKNNYSYDEFYKENELNREKHQSSGGALSATIITLSSGALYGLQQTNVKGLAWCYLFPIFSGITQQLLGYVGTRHRKNFSFWRSVCFLEKKSEDPEKYKRYIHNFDYESDTSDLYFKMAENAAILSWILFISATIVVVYLLGWKVLSLALEVFILMFCAYYFIQKRKLLKKYD